MNKPKYYVIEYNVLEDTDLSSTDKLVYMIINNFKNSVEFTFASNKYFCNVLNLSERTIQYSFKKLQEKKYIDIFYHNNKRMIKSINSTNQNDLINSDNKNDSPIEFDDNYDWLSEL